MRWSWKVGEVSGIAIYLHVTFLILVAWVGLGQLFAGGPAAAIVGLAFLIALFAYLARRMDYARATQAAAEVGQAMALLFGLAGLFGQPFLLFIALFVYIGAETEAEMAQLRAFFSGRRVREAMVTEFHSLNENAL